MFWWGFIHLRPTSGKTHCRDFKLCTNLDKYFTKTFEKKMSLQFTILECCQISRSALFYTPAGRHLTYRSLTTKTNNSTFGSCVHRSKRHELQTCEWWYTSFAMIKTFPHILPTIAICWSFQLLFDHFGPMPSHSHIHSSSNFDAHGSKYICRFIIGWDWGIMVD